MKNLIRFAVALMVMVFAARVSAQESKKTDTLKVYGNCDMCKARIEGSLKKKDGVISKRWNNKTLALVVSYDPAKITLQQIAQKVADVGYDNELVTAKDEAYGNLHQCCQYKRPEKQ